MYLKGMSVGPWCCLAVVDVRSAVRIRIIIIIIIIIINALNDTQYICLSVSQSTVLKACIVAFYSE